MLKLNKNKALLISVFILFLIAFTFILNAFEPDMNDMREHAKFARQMLTGERPTAGNFVVYWLINVFTLFQNNVMLSEYVLCVLLAFASTFRFQLAQQKVALYAINKNGQEQNFWYTALMTLSLFFIFCIPIPSYFLEGYFYFGNFAPNVWHNSTILFSFPFALLLFEQAYMQLQVYEPKRNYIILGLVVLNIFIKPSFFFVFVSVYPLFLLVKYKFNKAFWLAIIPLLVGITCIALEYWMIYLTTSTSVIDGEKSGVVFLPFYRNELFPDVWQTPIILVFSFLFPILYSIFNFSKVRKSLVFWFSAASSTVALLIYHFISETGPRASHGNFYWQIVICTWISFFIAFLALIRDFKTEGKTLKNLFLATIYSIHLIVGIIYFISLFVVGNYE